MGKWLVGAGILLVIILFLLWRQLDSSTPAAKAPAAEPTTVASHEPSAANDPVKAAVVEPKTDAPADKPGKVEKYDPKSDEFFFKHDEMVVPRISRKAVHCIEARPEKMDDMNKSIVFTFKQKVRNGKVEIVDVEIKESTLDDQALQACFLQEVRNAGWLDERMPDWDQEDQIKLGYRQLRKYTRANIEATGPEAPPMMPKPADH